MNSKGYGWIVLLGAIGAGLSQNSAAYDFAEAHTEAAVDWKHLQLSVSGGINGVLPTVTYTNPLTSLSTVSDGHYPFFDQRSAPSWNVGLISESGQTVNLRAAAEASATNFSGYANARIAVGAGPVTVGPSIISAEVTGSRQINYSIDGPGVLTITVPYSLSLSVSNSNIGYSYAEISAKGDFQGTGNVEDSSFDSLIRLGTTSSKSGDLVLDILANGAGHGTLSVNLALVSLVPEPETYAMLLAGLGLVSFIARRRKQIS
jgi:hypothetical protein